MQKLPWQDKVFIVAELSANHKQDFDLAIKNIEAIARTGADAVKLQTYKASSLTLDLSAGIFAPATSGLWKGLNSWELYEKASTPYEWHKDLKQKAEELGLICFSSPFDLEGVEFLENLDMPYYKIASPEVNDTNLIGACAKTGKPIIISCGLADDNDIELAIETCFAEGNKNVVLLQCTSEYPASWQDANLARLLHLKQKFGLEVGLSDHSLEPFAGGLLPALSVMYGAKVIEKHFTIDRGNNSFDAAFSMQEAEFKRMVDEIRAAELAIGKQEFILSERQRLKRRSLFAACAIKTGETINVKNVVSIRPGNGLEPKFLPDILGKTAKQNISKGTPLSFDLIG